MLKQAKHGTSRANGPPFRTYLKQFSHCGKLTTCWQFAGNLQLSKCHMWHVVYYMWHVTFYVLCMTCYVLCVTYYTMLHVMCDMLLVTCYVWHLLWYMTCYVLHVTCDMLCVKCDMWLVTCYMWHIMCYVNVWHVACETFYLKALLSMGKQGTMSVARAKL